MGSGRTDSGESNSSGHGARPRGSRWGMVVVKLAYARTESTGTSAQPVAQGPRPSLRVVPDPPSEQLPSLPRRPSRRAVVRAQVWGVPVSTHGRPVDQVNDEAALDSRIAEAVRLLGRL